MTRLIAHRALINGPNSQLENHPTQVQQCLHAGYDVEIDLRFQNQQWWLGHDQADYTVNTDFLCQPGLWIHAKDHSAAFELSQLWQIHPQLNFFWHEDDQRTMTSQGIWWSLAHHPMSIHSVAVMPEWHLGEDKMAQCASWQCAGICSDYVGSIR